MTERKRQMRGGGENVTTFVVALVYYKPGESTYDNDIYHRAQLVADGDP